MRNPPSYQVGYCRPPKRTQWQKGQCGNPNRIRKQIPKPIVDMIDEFFAGEIDLIEKGIQQTIEQKKVTYDFERLMPGATKVKTSEFASYIIENMGARALTAV